MPTPTGGSTFSIVDPTGVYPVDPLLGGTQWGTGGPVTVTYSFPGADSVWSTNQTSGYGPSTGSGYPWNGFQPLTAFDQQQVRLALDAWAGVAKVTFVEVAESATSVGDLRFAYTLGLDPGAAAQGYLPGGSYSPSTGVGTAYASAGDVWINADQHGAFDPALGTGEFQTLLHEIGHALGLKHPFQASGDFGVLEPEEDSYALTVMSYSALAGDPGSWMSCYPTAPMPYDIAAVQALYGVNTEWHAGADLYVFRQGSAYNQTLWDGGGKDTIRYDAASDGAFIDLRPGYWSRLGERIEIQGSDGTDYLSGFLRVRCEVCHPERLVAFSCKRRGLLRVSCPPPFRLAFGSSKSLQAILSARAVGRPALRLDLDLSARPEGR
jgi:hypothetical protein